jgi:hypothetical protein
MNYKKIHDNIIERAKHRIVQPNIKLATHHILPKCMNGNNDQNNLVRLTFREHCLIHLLLVKIYPSQYKLVYAAWMMYTKLKKLKSSYNSKVFEKLSILFCKIQSETHKGIKNHFFGKHHTKESKQKISDIKIKQGCIPPNRKGSSLSSDAKKRISEKMSGEKNPNFGKHLSEEHKQKLREFRIDKKLSIETKQKISNSTKGEKSYWFNKTHSVESKRKMSKIKRGIHQTEETKNKISISNKGRKVSEEKKLNMKNPKSDKHKQKIKEALLRYHEKKKDNLILKDLQ